MEVNENSASVRIYALGGLEITGGLFLRYRRRVRSFAAQQLLMGLVAAGARGFAAAMLCEALWPESSGGEAFHALIATANRLRLALHCHGALTFGAGRVALSPARCWVDAWAFEQAVLNPFAAGDEVPEGDLLNALSMYRGPLFGEVDSPLALDTRDRLRRLFASASLAAGRRLLRSGDVAGAIHLYERCLGAEGAHEELYRALILAQARSGHTLAAAESFERCRQALWHRFGTAPSRATERALNESCSPQAGSGEGRDALAAYSATP